MNPSAPALADGDRPARDFSDYILALDLPEAPPQLEAAEGVSIEYGSAREAVAVGAQIAEFSAQVSSESPITCACPRVISGLRRFISRSVTISVNS